MPKWLQFQCLPSRYRTKYSQNCNWPLITDHEVFGYKYIRKRSEHDTSEKKYETGASLVQSFENFGRSGT